MERNVSKMETMIAIYKVLQNSHSRRDAKDCYKQATTLASLIVTRNDRDDVQTRRP